jgi:EmrB/QacA subfamily drug resistance transporter
MAEERPPGAVAGEQPANGDPRSDLRVLVICGVGVFLTTLDLSIVNIAFPNILAEYDVSPADGSWVLTVYAIFYGSLLVVAGKVADRIGRRRVFRAGIALFGVGSAMGAVAPTLWFLVSARAVQGIGGALLTPASLGLLIGSFPAHRRVQVVAMWGGIGALGAAVAPSLGAGLVSVTNWRAAFWVNLPLVVAVLLARKSLAESIPDPSHHRPDYPGALLVTLALGSIVLGVSRSDLWGWRDGRTVGAIGAGVILAVVFVQRQRHHPEPILDLTLFRNRSFSAANAGSLLFFAGFAALGVNNVLFLRDVWGYSVMGVGAILLPAPITVAVLAPFTGRLAARYGFRPLLVLGPAAFALSGLGYLFLLGPSAQPLRYLATGEVFAIAAAIFLPLNAGAAVRDLPADRLSIGGAVNNTFRQIGSAVGVALLIAATGSPGDVMARVRSADRGWVLVVVLAAGSALVGTTLPGVSRCVDPKSAVSPRRR